MNRLVTSAVSVCLLLASSFAATNPTQHVKAPPQAQFPLAFEPNRGQTSPQVRYLSRSREGIIFFTDQGTTMSVPGQGSFRLQFIDATASADFLPETLLAARSNYLFSTASSIPNVENYAALLHRGVYPGIDIRYYGNSQHLEHDLIVAPGADVSAVTLQLEGVTNLGLDTAGNAQFQLRDISLRESVPLAWQTIAGKRVPVEAAWIYGSDNVVMQDPIPSGWAYAGIYTTTASCTTPTAGATSGTVVCKATRLESGKSFWVNVYLQAIGSSGSSLTNTVSTSAQTQDLNQSNNKVQVVVKVQ
jgi:hypothetical protein